MTYLSCITESSFSFSATRFSKESSCARRSAISCCSSTTCCSKAAQAPCACLATSCSSSTAARRFDSATSSWECNARMRSSRSCKLRDSSPKRLCWSSYAFCRSSNAAMARSYGSIRDRNISSHCSLSANCAAVGEGLEAITPPPPPPAPTPAAPTLRRVCGACGEGGCVEGCEQGTACMKPLADGPDAMALGSVATPPSAHSVGGAAPAVAVLPESPPQGTTCAVADIEDATDCC
mmetsp:Transcript_159070/g.510132  ORF Transcript_159070/g.510132 Transcript_159070/m.510132 type:complete len:236 (+) Transcript_159070:1640-2347(+)